MLLDARGNGYVFEVHRCKATWAVQWAKVANGAPPKDKTWASEEIDASHASVRDGGGLSRLTITRESDGAWTIAGKDWNKGAGATVRFTDATTSSFSQLVLLGTQNFDEQVFNKIVLATAGRQAAAATAIPVTDFLNSIGVRLHLSRSRTTPRRRRSRWSSTRDFAGSGAASRGSPTEAPRPCRPISTCTDKPASGSVGAWSAAAPISRNCIETARQLAAADALLAFEGNNEPNNWGVTYQGEKGGGRAPSWLAVAKLQRDLYNAVKSDPVLEEISRLVDQRGRRRSRTTSACSS